MPKHTFRSRALNQELIYRRAEEKFNPNGSITVLKAPEFITFNHGVFETTDTAKAEFIRSRMQAGAEIWEVSPHAQATPEHIVLGEVSKLALQANADDPESLLPLRELYKAEIDGPNREAVTGPLLEIFRTLGVSEKKPGRPAVKA